jgi:hypothetical protein
MPSGSHARRAEIPDPAGEPGRASGAVAICSAYPNVRPTRSHEPHAERPPRGTGYQITIIPLDMLKLPPGGLGQKPDWGSR